MCNLSNFEGVMRHLAACDGPRRKVAVVCPKDSHTLHAVELALERELADFIFVSDVKCDDAQRIKQRFNDHVTEVCEPDADAAARKAV